ncbi:MAG TPA: RodZ domain-containing protein [Bryobacteraceae bacterium]|jgi:transcriptional regulator with XRE-family HTH domain
MSSVGTLLRKSRLDQGVSLQDISARTRISVKNLEAIESGDLGQLSSPFVYRSFVRQFAAELKLDYDLLAPDVLAACDTMRQPLLPGEGNALIIRVAPIQPKIRRDFQWMYLAAILVVVIAAGSGTYALRARSLSPASAVTSIADSLGLTRTAHPATKAVAVAPSTAAVAVLPSSEVDSGIHIRLSAIETTWLSIVADGKQTYSGILKVSQTKSLEGRETARIKTGNAGGVTIVFNGKVLGPMGRHGEARTVLFTTTGYEVVRSAAEALIPALLAPQHRANALPFSRSVE